MKCKKCRRQLKRSTKYCPVCGTKVKCRFWKKLFMSVLLFFGGIGLVMWGIQKSKKTSEIISKVYNMNEAIEHAKSMGEEWGYENAFSELTEKSTANIDGDHYYRMQQNYKGIPVYGRDAIYVTNEEDNVMIITGNPKDIDTKMSLSPSATQEQIYNSIIEYAEKNLEAKDWANLNFERLREEDLCIYDFSVDRESHLAYKIVKNGYQFIVDANNAEILNVKVMLQNVYAYSSSDVKRIDGFEVKKNSDGYYLSNKWISNVYDWNGVSSGGFKDGGRSIENSVVVNSKDKIFGNDSGEENFEDAVRLYKNITRIASRIEGVCGFSEKLELYLNDGYDGGKNSLGGLYTNDLEKENKALISTGKVTGVDDIDVIGHEYGHVIFCSTLLDNNIDMGISEGVADIFGEIIESWYYQKSAPDWCMEGENIAVKRNIKNPHTTRNAQYINDEEIKKKDRDGYYYSTVISHTAYLMWNGVNGEEAAKISTEDIVKLWYRAILMMPSDCDFSTCREKIEWAALSMKTLTKKQRKCISDSFEAVGIQKKEKSCEVLLDCDQNIRKNSVLNVYDKQGEPYGNYILKIIGTVAENELSYEPIILTDFGTTHYYESTQKIDKVGPYHLELPEGYYTFTITDSNGKDQIYEFTVSVSSRGTENSIELYTDFENLPLVVNLTTEAEQTVYEIYQNAVEKSISSGNWREELNVTGDMNVASLDQNEKLKTKVMLESAVDVREYDEKNLSALKISGNGNIQTVGQEIEWTVDYSNGVAHYQYTKPIKSEKEVEVDPVCFEFKTLTKEMMQNASISGNVIQFTISGDQIKEVTSEAINMFDGIEDLRFGEGNIEIIIDQENGTISNINMKVDMSMKYMDYQTAVDYDMKYSFTPFQNEKSKIENEESYDQYNKSKIPEDAGIFNGHYYYVYDLDTITNWEEAKEYCERMGGYLASITSKEEDEFLYSYLQNTCESAYFGFTDKDEEGIWKWSNGEESSYTNWHDGEPNNTNLNENFGMYYYTYTDGSWNDGDFGNQTLNGGKAFICEWGEYQIGKKDLSESATVEEIYKPIFDEYQHAKNYYMEYSENEFQEKFPRVNEYLISDYLPRGGTIWYGEYDIDGNGQDELFIGYDTIEGVEWKIVDVFTYDTGNTEIKRIGNGELFSPYAGSDIYENGIIYISRDDMEEFYQINPDGYSLKLIEKYEDIGVYPDKFYLNDSEVLSEDEFTQKKMKQGKTISIEWKKMNIA